MKITSMFGWIGTVLISTALFATGCGSTAHVEKVNSVQMSSYRTYNWEKQTEKGRDKENRRNDILEQNIRDAIDAEMQKKGYTLSDKADLLISTDWAVAKNKQNRRSPVYTEPYQRSYYNYRTGRYNTYYVPSQFAGYENYSSTEKEATLTITLIDTYADKMVWQGWASRVMNQNTATAKDVEKNVSAIFKKFDPK